MLFISLYSNIGFCVFCVCNFLEVYGMMIDMPLSFSLCLSSSPFRFAINICSFLGYSLSETLCPILCKFEAIPGGGVTPVLGDTGLWHF